MCTCFKVSAEMSASLSVDEALALACPWRWKSGLSLEARFGILGSATGLAVKQLQWSAASQLLKFSCRKSCLFAHFHSLSVLTKQRRKIHTRHATVRAHACTLAHSEKHLQPLQRFVICHVSFSQVMAEKTDRASQFSFLSSFPLKPGLILQQR